MDGFLKALILAAVLFCHSIGAAQEILIPAGDFKMPAKLNKNSLKVTSFYIDAHPVTNSEYLEFVRKNPQWSKSQVKKLFADGSYLEYWSGDQSYGDKSLASSPVVRVSWFAAREYCAWKGQRLPSTNEWEYVALSPFKNRTEIKDLILEWYGRGAEWPLRNVKKNSPNNLGVYDLHGLIWEWVEDFNTSLVTGESRADGGLDKNLFCGAGASAAADPADYAAFMRFAFRSSLQAKYTVQNLGFRCARDKE
nr:formylglycine-generating enzyme family protein [Bdellovibrio sp. HAGR004]